MTQQLRGARISVFVDDEWLTCDGADPEESWKQIEEELNQVLKRLFVPVSGSPLKDVLAVFEEWEGKPEPQTPRLERRR